MLLPYIFDVFAGLMMGFVDGIYAAVFYTIQGFIDVDYLKIIYINLNVCMTKP